MVKKNAIKAVNNPTPTPIISNDTLIPTLIISNDTLTNDALNKKGKKITKKEKEKDAIKNVISTSNVIIDDATATATAAATATAISPVVKSKRGRKSKQELMASLNAANVSSSLQLQINELDVPSNTPTLLNKVNEISELFNTTNILNESNVIVSNELDELDDEDQDLIADVDADSKPNGLEKPVIKKRGRKPKGGKIIQQVVSIDNQKIERPNVIMHLKCSMKDLQSSINSSCLIESFNFTAKNDLSYEILNSSNIVDNKPYANNKLSIQNSNDIDIDCDEELTCKDNNKEIWRKLKQLEHNLHINNVNNKKSACFWCTCDFDNPPVYIPKHFINETYHVYGCFCSPECGTAHLMNESIDSSAKHERYHLLNHIYSKIYDYKKNVKPAPNPYYMLEKFYGNLTIQEYRGLFRNERLFLIVDKPLTRILPELHEDNDEFILNNKIIPSNNYQLKSRMQKKKPNKGSILNEKFGLSNNQTLNME